MIKMEKVITYEEDVKKIPLFDILISDIHAGDEYSTIDCSIGLTYHEVWEWISEGGDWAFRVVEHKNPDNVFMTGNTYQSMNSARKGVAQVVLGHVTEEEIDELSFDFKEKARKRYGLN